MAVPTSGRATGCAAARSPDPCRPTLRVVRLALVAGIVTLARAIEAHVIAEGVETLPQLTALSALRVDSASGYLLARPSAPQHLPLTIPAEASFRWRTGLHPTVARAPGETSTR